MEDSDHALHFYFPMKEGLLFSLEGTVLLCHYKKYCAAVSGFEKRLSHLLTVLSVELKRENDFTSWEVLTDIKKSESLLFRTSNSCFYRTHYSHCWLK